MSKEKGKSRPLQWKRLKRRKFTAFILEPLEENVKAERPVISEEN